MRRSSPDRILTAQFRRAGLTSYRYHGPLDDAPMLVEPPHGAACWLKQHDLFDRPCSEVTNGRLEVMHFIGRQRIRAILGHNLRTGFDIGAIDPVDVEDLIELAEWDPRNAGIGCTVHHRRLDGHSTPELKLPIEALPDHVLEFILDWGLEAEAERKFAGDVAGRLESFAGHPPMPGDEGGRDAGPGADQSPPTIAGDGIAPPFPAIAGDGAGVPDAATPGGAALSPLAPAPSRAIARRHDERSTT